MGAVVLDVVFLEDDDNDNVVDFANEDFDFVVVVDDTL